MKKKYRGAVYLTLIGIPCIITLPFMCIGWTLEKLAIGLMNYSDWLKNKLRVYDYAPPTSP